jgi:hypothetical protein
MLKKMEKFFVFHFMDRRPQWILMLPYLFSFKQLWFHIVRLSSSIFKDELLFRTVGGWSW